ncbi:MAG: regulatory protein RecX [Candidatus Omnitrophica bacterium]|nr:regulatory protein RecX [Candidatus Omnitrophota bacterium]
MSKNRSDSLQKAKNYAFLLLKFRQRSTKELTRRLEQKHFEGPVIKETIAFLKEHSFINDADFARAWIDSRLKKPLGLRRIRQELRIKGVDKSIIDSNVNRIRRDYSEEKVVAEIAAGRLARLKGIEPQKAKHRVFSYLLRRGFSPDIISDTLAGL